MKDIINRDWNQDTGVTELLPGGEYGVLKGQRTGSVCGSGFLQGFHTRFSPELSMQIGLTTVFSLVVLRIPSRIYSENHDCSFESMPAPHSPSAESACKPVQALRTKVLQHCTHVGPPLFQVNAPIIGLLKKLAKCILSLKGRVFQNAGQIESSFKLERESEFLQGLYEMSVGCISALHSFFLFEFLTDCCLSFLKKFFILSLKGKVTSRWMVLNDSRSSVHSLTVHRSRQAYSSTNMCPPGAPRCSPVHPWLGLHVEREHATRARVFQNAGQIEPPFKLVDCCDITASEQNLITNPEFA